MSKTLIPLHHFGLKLERNHVLKCTLNHNLVHFKCSVSMVSRIKQKKIILSSRH